MLKRIFEPQRRCWACQARVRSADLRCPGCGEPLLLDGRYEIVGRLGRGGSGTVYNGNDLRLERRCAIKAVSADQLHFRDAVEAEWRLLRDHAAALPFIPDVYDVLRTHGAVYLVMEYIQGETLDQSVAREGPWSAPRVEAFLRALLAILADLHAHGLIHRDLKPQNIKSIPATASSEGRYVLLDFGIARRDNEHTQLYAHAATWQCSPPEQRLGQRTDNRSDLFSLAATAYHLLTGDAPPDIVAFLQTAQHELLADLLQAQVSPALGHTLLLMLQLSPDDRPASAQAALALLDATWPSLPLAEPPTGPDTAAIPGSIPDTLPMVDSVVLGRGAPADLSWSPDGRFLAVAAATGVYIYDASTLELVQILPTAAPARQAIFLGDGALLLTAAGRVAQLWHTYDWSCARVVHDLDEGAFLALSPDGQLLAIAANGLVQMRQMGDGALRYELATELTSVADSVAFSPDGQQLAVATADGLQLLRAADGAPLHSLQVEAGGLARLAFAPDSTLLAAGQGCALRIWDVARGTLLHTLERPEPIRKLLFASNSRLVATLASRSGCISRIRDGGLLLAFEEPDLAAAAFGPGGRELAIAAAGGIVVRELPGGRVTRSLHAHQGPVRGIALAPDGRTLAVAGVNTSIWRLDAPAQQHLLLTGAGYAGRVAFSLDGQTLAIVTSEAVALWRTADWTRAGLFPRGGEPDAVAFTADGQLVVAAVTGIERWQLATAERFAAPIGAHDSDDGVALAPDGTTAAVIAERVVRLWRIVDGGALGAPIETEHEIDGVAIARDGAAVALFTDAEILVYSADDPDVYITLEAGGQRGAFSPDGRLLASAMGPSIQLWLLDGAMSSLAAPLYTLKGHAGAVSCLAFSSDGRCLVSGSWDGTVRLWELGPL